jgi:uncharacterized SAM-binding protein YcdF (DUF218 family)
MIDPVDLLLPGAFYLAVGLAALAVHAVARRPAWASRRMRVALVLAALWSWILSAPGFANLAIAPLEGPRDARAHAVPDERTLIVVLASGNLYARSGVPMPRLDASGWQRLDAGITLWRRTGGKLLFTGGPVEGQSLAERMRDFALQAGVPREAIEVTPRSTNTHEDLALSRERIAPHSGRAWLVTSALHMPRALAVARKLGLDMKPHPTDFRQLAAPTWRAWFPDDGGPALWAAVIHEWVGHAYYRALGRVD